MKIEITTKDYLRVYREACLVTVGKKVVDDWKPKDEFKFWVKHICANHSALRLVHFTIKDDPPKSVVMQLIRATKGHPQPEVCSSRPDWCGKERSSDPYEKKLFMQEHTAESFVEMAKQRLCVRTEDKTRKEMNDIVMALRESEEPFLRAVGYCCHPFCWWYGACPEVKGCGMNPSLSKRVLALAGYGE